MLIAVFSRRTIVSYERSQCRLTRMPELSVTFAEHASVSVAKVFDETCLATVFGAEQVLWVVSSSFVVFCAWAFNGSSAGGR